MATRKQRAQAFVELASHDPEATSAFAVARERLEAGRALASLRRFRVFEIAGALLERDVIAQRLYGSTQFYNPAKERCTLRVSESDATPAPEADALVLVTERGGDRREGAERWWRHEARQRIEVREGVVWALAFAPGADAAALAEELAVTRDRAHGLFANPHFQDHRVVVGGAPPLDWLTRRVPRGTRRGGRPA